MALDMNFVTMYVDEKDEFSKRQCDVCDTEQAGIRYGGVYESGVVVVNNLAICVTCALTLIAYDRYTYKHPDNGMIYYGEVYDGVLSQE